VFFATRTPAMSDASDGYRYWRFVELPDQELVSTDLQILRRIDPHGGEPAEFEGIDLEATWEAASADIVATHNERTRSEEDAWPLEQGAIAQPGERLLASRRSPVRSRLAPLGKWLQMGLF
jgi:hypothetical protein